jgi:hypothetical protein
MSKLLESICGAPDKPLIIGDFEIPCYILENEKRVITQGGLLTALGMSTGGANKAGTRKIDEFLDNTAINPFIDKDVIERVKNVIPFKIQGGGNTAYAYDATILVDICAAVLESERNGKLHKAHKHIAIRAAMLYKAFAKVGIIALIDEATGYEKLRSKNTLQNFLDKFLLEERAKWIGTFPDEFFEVIFKMKGWTWNYASTKKPSVVGHYINNFVYSRIAPKVLDELKDKNPVIETNSGKHRKYKHTQFISPDYGHPILKEHLHAIIALAKGAGFNWLNFQRLINRAFPKYGKDMEIDFKDDDIIE